MDLVRKSNSEESELISLGELLRFCEKERVIPSSTTVWAKAVACRGASILGHAQNPRGCSRAKAWVEKLRTDVQNSRPERAFIIISVAAFDWNCSQNITQRFTLEGLQLLKARGHVEDL
jgi:hypothetical protein